MSELRAELRNKYDHPDVIVHVEAELVPVANWLPSYFNEQVASGVRFAADEVIQIGWGLLKLAANSTGDLLVQEPDFQTMPVRWIEGASSSVRFLALQRAICDELGVDPDFPSLRQAGYAPLPFPGADKFTMTRSDASGSLSGWTFHQTTDAEVHLISLYEAVLANKAIIPFLALPEGSIVERDDEELSVSAQGQHRTSVSSSLLESILDTYGMGGA